MELNETQPFIHCNKISVWTVLQFKQYGRIRRQLKILISEHKEYMYFQTLNNIFQHCPNLDAI